MLIIIGSLQQLLADFGVPQGSLLEPSLFSIHVNDMQDTSKIGEIHLCTDDRTVFVILKTVVEAILCRILIRKDIELWRSIIKLTISKEKTAEHVILNSKSFIRPMNHVIMSGIRISQVTKTK